MGPPSDRVAMTGERRGGRGWRKLAVALVAVALLSAGCGSSNGGSTGHHTSSSTSKGYGY